MLTIADVSKSYGTRELFADVSLFIARTDRLGLIGPNGAGKSTLFGLILGEEKPDTGTATGGGRARQHRGGVRSAAMGAVGRRGSLVRALLVGDLVSA